MVNNDIIISMKNINYYLIKRKIVFVDKMILNEIVDNFDLLI